MFDVFALGDILIDFTPLAPSQDGNPVFECNAGGTVANLAAGCAVLGLKTILAGKVGDEPLGHHVIDVIAKKGVDVSAVVFDKEHYSTQTIISLKDGERSFTFSRKHNADILYSKEDLQIEKLTSSKILHVSGMNFTYDPSKAASFYALEEAKENGVIRTLDINYRPWLWSSERDFALTMRQVTRQIDIYKGSDDETLLVTGEKNLEDAANKIHHWGPKIVIISGSYRGARFYHNGKSSWLNTYDTQRIDTTGAGDCFMSALLYRVIKRGGIKDFSHEELTDIIDFANAAGAVSITKRGGVSSMPTINDIEDCRKNVSKLVLPWEME